MKITENVLVCSAEMAALEVVVEAWLASTTKLEHLTREGERDICPECVWDYGPRPVGVDYMSRGAWGPERDSWVCPRCGCA